MPDSVPNDTLNVNPLAVAASCGTDGVFTHPAFSRTVDDGHSVRCAYALLASACDRAVQRAAATDYSVRKALLMFGSSVIGKHLGPRADTDFALRVRFDINRPQRGPLDAQRLIAPGVESLLRELVLQLAGTPGVRVLRLHTGFDGTFAREGPVPVGTTLHWSPVAVACGSHHAGTREVSLREAAMHAQIFKLALMLEDSGTLRSVELAVECSFLAPGGMCDISGAFTGFWFAKCAFTREDADTAVEFERELSSLFPGRYSPVEFARAILTDAAVSIAQASKPVKAAKIGAILCLFEGDERRYTSACEMLSGPTSPLAIDSLASRLAVAVACAVGRELNHSELVRLIAEAARACPDNQASLHGGWLSDSHQTTLGDALHTIVNQDAGDPSLWPVVGKLSLKLAGHARATIREAIHAEPEKADRVFGARLTELICAAR